MTENSKQGAKTDAASQKLSAKQREAKKKRTIIIFVIEVIFIVIMLYLLCMMFWPKSDKESDKTSGEVSSEESKGLFSWLFEDGPLFFVTKGGILSNEEGLKVTVLETTELEIPQEIIEQKEEGGKMQGYMNIALFGVDAEEDEDLYKGSRSDSIMIASINMDTGDIKLVSVYRDTYLNVGTDTYIKCNHAYAYGGAEQAVKMLNMNLDMDITNFVTVGYQGLVDVIDGLGGIYIEVDDAERKHINNYQMDIAEVLKSDYTPITESGYQLLDGIQASAYCRIRYTAGDDFKRASRHREVLKAIEEQAKKADLVTLTKVFNEAIDDIYTSLDQDTILDLLGKIADYQIVEEGGFPEESMRTVANIGAKGSSVIPMDLEANVVWLHQFLFDDADYTVTDSVREYGEKIRTDTEKYIKKN